MRNVLGGTGRRVARNQNGNVAVLFAFSAIPLVGLLGGAVDVTRHARHKTQILNAMDSAAIALARRGAKNGEDADRFVNERIATMMPGQPDPMLNLASFNATEIGGGWRVESDGAVETAFLRVVGIPELPLDLQAQVMRTGGKYEVALALDNTGSMDEYGRMVALREAAGNLVDDLYREDGAEDRVKMALIPFVTAVNIKSRTPGVFDPAWIDPVGDPATFGQNFSEPADRLGLFGSMHVDWAGCVEARQEGDEDDTPPGAAATRWVPYLWPDEPDGWPYTNSYLDDSHSGKGKGKGGKKAKGAGGNSNADPRIDVAKYDVPAGTIVPDRTDRGPNAACPRPIVELTNDKDRIGSEIGLMKPHNAGDLPNNSGTNVAQGLAWGWRVLSPDAPFDQGASYDDPETTKVLVLLSDGRNQIVRANGDKRVTGSDYTSYGYLADGRLGTTDSRDRAEKAVDAKVQRICENIRGEGIRIYTILFQVDFEKTQDIFRDCASKDDKGEPLYYYVPNAGALETAFQSIGRDLTNIHVAR